MLYIRQNENWCHVEIWCVMAKALWLKTIWIVGKKVEDAVCVRKLCTCLLEEESVIFAWWYVCMVNKWCIGIKNNFCLSFKIFLLLLILLEGQMSWRTCEVLSELFAASGSLIKHESWQHVFSFHGINHYFQVAFVGTSFNIDSLFRFSYYVFIIKSIGLCLCDSNV